MAENLDLTGDTIASTYVQLLHIGKSEGLEAAGTGHFVVDGNGTESVLSLDVGRVGIGTEAPAFPLEILAGTTASATVAAFFNAIDATDEYVELMLGQANTTGNCASIRYVRAGDNNAANRLTLGVRDHENAMVITHGSKIGIGTDAPNWQFEIEAASSAGGGILSFAASDTTAPTAGDDLGTIYFSGRDSDTYAIGAYIKVESDGNWGDLSADNNDAPSRMKFHVQDDGTGNGGGTAAITIDSQAFVGIGTEGPSSLCHIKTTDADDILSATVHALHVESAHAGIAAGEVLVRLDFSADSDVDGDEAKFISFHDADGEIGYIAAASASAMHTAIQTSDIRLKTDIKDSSLEGLNIINALKIRDFKWNNKAKKNIIGLQETDKWIADEVYEVYPKAVHGKPGRMMNGTDDEGKRTDEKVMYPIGLSPAEFIAPMMKAIQELSAKVTALENA